VAPLLFSFQNLTNWRWVGCRSPLTASQRAKFAVSKHKLKERASMGEGTIIGFDLAEDVFEVHGRVAKAVEILWRRAPSI
jgi:hypothetical protein